MCKVFTWWTLMCQPVLVLPTRHTNPLSWHSQHFPNPNAIQLSTICIPVAHSFLPSTLAQVYSLLVGVAYLIMYHHANIYQLADFALHSHVMIGMKIKHIYCFNCHLSCIPVVCVTHKLQECLQLTFTVVEKLLLFVKLVYPFRRPINQHFCWGLLFLWSYTSVPGELLGCGRNARNVAKYERRDWFS